MLAAQQEAITSGVAADVIPRDMQPVSSRDSVRRTKGIASPIVRPAFLKFLGNSVWEEGWEKPSDSDLVDLAILAKEEGRAEPAASTAAKMRYETGVQKK